MDDRERRVVSDMNSSYLDAQAVADIERLEIELREGEPLTVCDYDGDETNPTWLVVEGVAHFDPARGMWQIAYKMDYVQLGAAPRLSPLVSGVIDEEQRRS